MEPTTLQALEESIAHWQRLSTYQHKKGEKPVVTQCALCNLFVNCFPCPVRQRTGVDGCGMTPYGKANSLFNYTQHTQSDKFLKAARKELLFLVSLLPDGHPTKKIYYGRKTKVTASV